MKRRAMKIIRRICLACVLFVVLVATVGALLIDRFARTGVEVGATYALGVRTTLDGLDVGLLSGRVSLSDLEVRNPSGFDSPHFLTLGTGRLALGIASLLGDKPVISEFTLSGIDLNLERKGTNANYKHILDALKKFDSGDEQPADRNPETPRKKFVVDRVTVSDINVHVSLLPIGGRATLVPIRIERIELTNVGADSGGLELARLSAVISKAILDSVVAQAGHLLPPDIAGELRQGLGALGHLGVGTVKVLGQVTTVVGGQVVKVGEVTAEMLLGGVKLGAAVVGETVKGGATVLEEVGKGGQKVLQGAGKGIEQVGKGLGNLLKPKSREKTDRRNQAGKTEKAVGKKKDRPAGDKNDEGR